MSPSNAYSIMGASIAGTCIVMFFLGEPPWILLMGGVCGAIGGLMGLIQAAVLPHDDDDE